MNQKTKTPESTTLRLLTVLLNGVLFLVNFLLFYLSWFALFPRFEGLARVIPCWVLAYGVTWLLVRLTRERRMVRVGVTFGLLAVLAFIILSR